MTVGITNIISTGNNKEFDDVSILSGTGNFTSVYITSALNRVVDSTNSEYIYGYNYFTGTNIKQSKKNLAKFETKNIVFNNGSSTTTMKGNLITNYDIQLGNLTLSTSLATIKDNTVVKVYGYLGFRGYSSFFWDVVQKSLVPVLFSANGISNNNVVTFNSFTITSENNCYQNTSFTPGHTSGRSSRMLISKVEYTPA